MSAATYMFLATLSGPFVVFWDEYSWNQVGPAKGDYTVIFWGIGLIITAIAGGVLVLYKKRLVGLILCAISVVAWLGSGCVIGGVGV